MSDNLSNGILDVVNNLGKAISKQEPVFYCNKHDTDLFKDSIGMDVIGLDVIFDVIKMEILLNEVR